MANSGVYLTVLSRAEVVGFLACHDADLFAFFMQGMDLDALCKSRRFGFVDGLTGLYAATMDSQPPPSSLHSAPVPDGDGVIAGRGGGRTATADAIKTQVDGALSRLLPAPPGKRILLVDGLDAYVAMTPPGSASEAESLLMGLREVRFLPPFPVYSQLSL